MANEYATVIDAINRSPSLASMNDVELQAALTASSRWIDGYCDRKFWLDPTVTVRVFKACDIYVLDLGPHEIGSSTGVIVKTDDGSGTFATTVAASAYQLEPVNAAYYPTGGRPYTSIRAVSTGWPLTYSESGRQELVQVTARYGWPTVPDGVREACLALTTINRVENPTGVRAEAIDGYSVSYPSSAMTVAGGPMGHEIIAHLAPYRRMWAA